MIKRSRMQEFGKRLPVLKLARDPSPVPVIMKDKTDERIPKPIREELEKDDRVEDVVFFPGTKKRVANYRVTLKSRDPKYQSCMFIALN